MKYKETILIILIIINVVLSITLGIKNSKYKVLSEDDKKYISVIDCVFHSGRSGIADLAADGGQCDV